MSQRYLVGRFNTWFSVWWNFWRRCPEATANWDFQIHVGRMKFNFRWQGK